MINSKCKLKIEITKIKVQQISKRDKVIEKITFKQRTRQGPLQGPDSVGSHSKNGSNISIAET